MEPFCQAAFPVFGRAVPTFYNNNCLGEPDRQIAEHIDLPCRILLETAVTIFARRTFTTYPKMMVTTLKFALILLNSFQMNIFEIGYDWRQNNGNTL